jgi:hypothetical protein
MYPALHGLWTISGEEALLLIQEVFDRLSYLHSRKPKLKECKKAFNSKWGVTNNDQQVPGDVE